LAKNAAENKKISVYIFKTLIFKDIKLDIFYRQ